jgi:hypothetical protein
MKLAQTMNSPRKIAFVARRHFQTPKLVKLGWNAACVVTGHTRLSREFKKRAMTNTVVTCVRILSKSDWH